MARVYKRGRYIRIHSLQPKEKHAREVCNEIETRIEEYCQSILHTWVTCSIHSVSVMCVYFVVRWEARFFRACRNLTAIKLNCRYGNAVNGILNSILFVVWFRCRRFILLGLLLIEWAECGKWMYHKRTQSRTCMRVLIFIADFHGSASMQRCTNTNAA